MKRKVFIISSVLVAGFLIVRSFFNGGETLGVSNNQRSWEFQAIDTMKYSRDLTAEKIDDASFDKTIEEQVKAISGTGATHIGIATPYDERFVPMLKRWVRIARKYNLKIWFRGNFSGWEKWFGFSGIDREEHKRLTREFILTNPELFENGDVFSPCPECENGGPGDPRQTGDVSGHRKFLIDEYEIAKDAFLEIDKDVESNYASMNLDVAKLVMDKSTTEKMGRLVVIDHYIKSPADLAKDASEIAQKSGGRVVLGEFGAPIPDIHGDLNQKDQAKWIDEALSGVVLTNDVVGVSYWTSFGGSTKLWDDDGKTREVAKTLSKYYKPQIVSIKVVNKYDRPVKGAVVSTVRNSYSTDNNGIVQIPVLGKGDVSVQKIGFEPVKLNLSQQAQTHQVSLQRTNGSSIFSEIADFLGI